MISNIDRGILGRIAVFMEREGRAIADDRTRTDVLTIAEDFRFVAGRQRLLTAALVEEDREGVEG